MQPALELALFQSALTHHVPPGTTVATLYIDLAVSNGKIHLRIYRDPVFYQLRAILQSLDEPWDYYSSPITLRGEMVLPDFVVRDLRGRLRTFGIRHLIGILRASRVQNGRMLCQEPIPNQRHMN